MAEGQSTHGVPVAEDSSTGGESKLRQSWWSVHAPKLGLQVARKSYQRQGVPIVVLAPERLWEDCNATRVRYGRWMGFQNRPHNETLTLIFSNSSVALIPCEEKGII